MCASKPQLRLVSPPAERLLLRVPACTLPSRNSAIVLLDVRLRHRMPRGQESLSQSMLSKDSTESGENDEHIMESA